MAIENIPINSGTGPKVAVDLVGTDNYQIVKLMQAADGSTASMEGPWAVTGTNFTVASLATGTVTIAAGTITTLLGTVSVSGGGGGVQYPDGTVVNATATGTVVFGVSNNTARSIAIHTTGGLIVASMPAVGGGQQYSVGGTDMGATATGTVFIGMQSGGTTGRGIAVTTTGAVHTVFVTTQAVTAANVTIASVTTGTISVVNVLSASGITVASLATGTVNVVNVLSASGVTVASLTTGTVNVVNTVAVSGTLTATLLATTANVGAFVGTAHASRWDAYAVNTTSGASVIVKTSGAHTLYITDMVLSVDVPSRVDIFSAATTKLSLYLATKGGFSVGLTQPMVLNTNQSLTFTPSVSGSAMLFAAGYTVT